MWRRWAVFSFFFVRALVLTTYKNGHTHAWRVYIYELFVVDAVWRVRCGVLSSLRTVQQQQQQQHTTAHTIICGDDLSLLAQDLRRFP